MKRTHSSITWTAALAVVIVATACSTGSGAAVPAPTTTPLPTGAAGSRGAGGSGVSIGPSSSKGPDAANRPANPGYTIEQAISDRAQQNTIAFDALGFLTGTLGADSFFPPGKVADFWGFQYLRDNDPSQMGHNTDFLTRASIEHAGGADRRRSASSSITLAQAPRSRDPGLRIQAIRAHAGLPPPARRATSPPATSGPETSRRSRPTPPSCTRWTAGSASSGPASWAHSSPG